MCSRYGYQFAVSGILVGFYVQHTMVSIGHALFVVKASNNGYYLRIGQCEVLYIQFIAVSGIGCTNDEELLIFCNAATNIPAWRGLTAKYQLIIALLGTHLMIEQLVYLCFFG